MNPYVRKQSEDWRDKYQRVDAKYDALSKSLALSCSRKAVIPAYAYYMCKNIELEHKCIINRLMFLLDTSRSYNVEELKGVQSWEELDIKDTNTMKEDTDESR